MSLNRKRHLSTQKGSRKGQIKDLLHWKLSELLGAAKDRGWIPNEIQPHGGMDPRETKTPVSVDMIAKVRNLVHPARYLRERKGKAFESKELWLLYATCWSVSTCVQEKRRSEFGLPPL